ncbi:MAG TPA: tetratricopeptide repeat protein, partial [Pirellulales bacterium]|nr:tetratricopeptide repeat protein [Pirellulales bacterium]
MSIAGSISSFARLGRRKRLALVGVWALVLLAGCSGSPDEQSMSAMREPAPRKSHAAADATLTSDGGSPAGGVSVEDSVAAAGDAAADTAARSPSTVDLQLQEDLIRSVIDNFNRLDEFEPNQIFPQLRDRLNQWMLQSRPSSAWQRDPLLGTLDPALASAPLIGLFTKNLETGLFTISDMVALQEAIWLRDVAKNARGDQLDELSIAEQLFDWTVRNLQLVEDPPAGSPAVDRSPAEILLLGRGTVRERAWIFLLLLRQQGLDGVVLAIPGEDKSAPREWLTALVADQDLFLFDPLLGMPVPGPAGHRIATLADVTADDGVLRKLDLSSTHPYPVKAEQLAHLVAYVEASPTGLSRRMETLEARLTGDQRVILTARPQRVAERLTGRPQIDQVRYWSLPYEFWRARGALKPGERPASAADLIVFEAVPPLTKARALQFKGQVDGARGAKDYYFKARLSKQQVAHSRMRPEEKKFWELAKQDASYWLGLIAFEQKNYPVAIDYFSRRTLDATPDGPWTDGAHYNLGRTYEANGQLSEAIEFYQSDRSPQKHGNRLRARRLKAQMAA